MEFFGDRGAWAKLWRAAPGGSGDERVSPQRWLPVTMISSWKIQTAPTFAAGNSLTSDALKSWPPIGNSDCISQLPRQGYARTHATLRYYTPKERAAPRSRRKRFRRETKIHDGGERGITGTPEGEERQRHRSTRFPSGEVALVSRFYVNKDASSQNGPAIKCM